MNSLSKGFSLLEVLISLLLLALTLLGVNMLSAVLLRENSQAFYGMVAEQQLENMEERLQMLGETESLEEQVAFWNEENQALLPQGKGNVLGSFPSYQLQLFWKDGTACDSLNL